MTVRRKGQGGKESIKANNPAKTKKPSPTEVHRYEFAAKKTLGLFTGAALRLAIIILVTIGLALLMIYFVSG